MVNNAMEMLLESISRCLGSQPLNDGNVNEKLSDKAKNEWKGKIKITDKSSFQGKGDCRKSGNDVTSGENQKSSRADLSSSSSSFASSKYSSLSRMEMMKKRSNKRKSDIFRNRGPEITKPKPPPNTSFASNFLGGNFNAGAILCFANPIDDDEDDEPAGKVQRVDSSSSLPEHYDDDVDTITSTQFFDAKYEHVVEQKPPLQLFSEFAVLVTEEFDDEIRQIMESGTHKSNSFLMRETPPPPPSSNTQSIQHINSLYDNDSYCSDASEASQSEDEKESEGNSLIQGDPSESIVSQLTNNLATPTPSACGLYHSSSSQFAPSRDTCDGPPGMKLLSKSSVSTAALTIADSGQSFVSHSPVTDSKRKVSSAVYKVLEGSNDASTNRSLPIFPLHCD